MTRSDRPHLGSFELFQFFMWASSDHFSYQGLRELRSS